MPQRYGLEGAQGRRNNDITPVKKAEFTTCLTNMLRKCLVLLHSARIRHGTVQRFVINVTSAFASVPSVLLDLRYTDKFTKCTVENTPLY